VGYNEEGNIIEMGEYHENLKHGKWVKWNFAGVKVGEIKYDHGHKDGRWEIWDSKGTLRYVMFYEDGKRRGTWKIFDRTGALAKEENYDISF
jgi:antitoxin component YwqK of YwqJK toxin-antitoxin module